MMGNPVPSKLCLVTRTTWLAISTSVLRFPRSRECLSKRILAFQIAYYVIHRIVIHIFHVCILPFRYNAENFDIKFNQWISRCTIDVKRWDEKRTSIIISRFGVAKCSLDDAYDFKVQLGYGERRLRNTYLHPGLYLDAVLMLSE